jgi:hypothetical protein
MMVTMVQGFGLEGDGYYKALIQAPSGHQFFVWYDNLLGARNGSVVKAIYSGSGSYFTLHTLTNIGNGKQARVNRYVRAN